jgi:hypothetical protein
VILWPASLFAAVISFVCFDFSTVTMNQLTPLSGGRSGTVGVRARVGHGMHPTGPCHSEPSVVCRRGGDRFESVCEPILMAHENSEI